MNSYNNFYSFFDLDSQEKRINAINDFLKYNSIESIDKENENTLLLCAIADNNLEIVKHLIERGANVNGDRKAKCYPLERAVITGNIKIINALQNTKKLIFSRQDDMSLIFAISYQNSIEICSLLIDNGMNINIKQSDGYTPLFWAMQQQNLKLISFLIDNGADVNAIDINGQTPLYQAAGDNNMDEVRLLLKNKAEIDLTKDCTPFMIACTFDNFDVALELYKNGANVNYQDEDGRTALFYSMVKQNNKMSEFLISIGASLKVVDNYGVYVKDLKNNKIRQKLYDELFGY